MACGMALGVPMVRPVAPLTPQQSEDLKNPGKIMENPSIFKEHEVMSIFILFFGKDTPIVEKQKDDRADSAV